MHTTTTTTTIILTLNSNLFKVGMDKSIVENLETRQTGFVTLEKKLLKKIFVNDCIILERGIYLVHTNSL